ncbi:MAG: helix-turn-helix domain-containing protein [Polyangiaceae bacterium]
MGQDREQPYSEEHIEPAAEAESEIAGDADPLVSAALELFRARPDTRWTVESIAKELGTSRPVLNRRFNEALGKPPLSVLREFRMEKASRLLLETDEGLAAIADEVGYDSEFALSRAFYRHFGVRPGAWRRGAAASHTHRSSDLTRCAA